MLHVQVDGKNMVIIIIKMAIIKKCHSLYSYHGIPAVLMFCMLLVSFFRRCLVFFMCFGNSFRDKKTLNLTGKFEFQH